MKIIAIALMALLSGCASTGANYTAAPVPKNQAQVVIYRPSAFVGFAVSSAIELNGRPTCHLANNSHISRNFQPGPTTISASTWSMPGNTRLTFNAAPGKQYYIRVQFNNEKVMSWGMGGLVGGLAAEAISNSKGPMLMNVVDPTQGRAEVAQTKQATSCN